MNSIQDQFFEMLTTAVHLRLIPAHTTELEFNVDHTGQCNSMEYWPTVDRVDNQRVKVQIPERLSNAFKFTDVGVPADFSQQKK